MGASLFVACRRFALHRVQDPAGVYFIVCGKLASCDECFGTRRLEHHGTARTRSPGRHEALPGVVANDAVNFDLARGEVHTLLGENGAGKSTLASVLCGLYRPEEGQVVRNGAEIRLNSPRDGLAHGIAMVHQHFRLVDRFTVAENVVLGHKSLSFVLATNDIEEKVAAITQEFGLPLDPRAVVGELSAGERQRVEIVKALYQGAECSCWTSPPRCWRHPRWNNSSSPFAP